MDVVDPGSGVETAFPPLQAQPAGKRAWWHDALPAAGLFVASVLFMGAVLIQPVPGQPVLAAVFPPGMAADGGVAAVARAGGLIVREGFVSNIVIARSDAPDFVRRLRDAGALFVVDPISAFGCLRPGARLGGPSL